MNKRGISTVIVTVLLIVLTLVLVAIVWAVINRLIIGNTEGITLEKLTLNADIEQVRINASTNNVSILLKRNQGAGEIQGFRFIFYNSTGTEFATTDIALEELASMRFEFNPDMNVSTLIKIAVVPLFKSSSGKETLGNVADTYNFRGGETQGYIPGGCVPAIGNLCGTAICGSVANGTCGQISCGGDCPIGQSCVSGSCVATCTPANCISLGYTCGNWQNGTCAETLNCGTCGTGYNCVSGSCVSAGCTPISNPCGTAVCGTATNGTCGQVSCGTCTGGQSCVGGSCQTTTNLCDGMVLLMHFDNESSVGENDTFVYDWSGNNRNGFPRDINLTNEDGNTPPIVNSTNGRFNQGFWFDGVDDYIRVPINTSLTNNLSDGTISAWIYLNRTDNSVSFISSYSYGISGTWNFGKTWASNRLFAAYSFITPTNVNQLVQDTVSLSYNTWMNYIVTWNDTAIYGYINGILKSVNSTYRIEYPYFRMYNNNGRYLSIGALSNGDPPTTTGGWGFRGKMDDVAIWNRSLTTSEISNIYNSGTAISC